MAIPIIDPALGDPDVREQVIIGSNNADLEKIRQHVLGAMDILARQKPIPSDYAVWSVFVGEIEAEQHRRARISN